MTRTRRWVDRRERLGSGIAAALVLAGLVTALVLGLRLQLPGRAGHDALVAVRLTPEPPTSRSPTPPPVHAERRARLPAGAAALRNRATAVVAPRLPALLPPPPVVAAPVAASGAATANGASDRAGPGQGAGGAGNGPGGGGSGDGDAGEDERFTRPELIRGRLRFSDLPAAMRDGGQPGEVAILYVVGIDGRVGTCKVTRLQGPAELGRRVCDLVQQRFRFRPSRDRDGNPVVSKVSETHGWSFPPSAPSQP